MALSSDAAHIETVRLLEAELAETRQALTHEREKRQRLEKGRLFNDRVADALLDAISDALLLITPEARILRINQAMRRWYDIPDSLEATGQRLWDLLSEEERVRRKKRLTAVLATGRPLHYEDQNASRHMALSIWPVFDSDKTLIALFVLGRDITARKEAEIRTKHQQEQLIQAAKMVALGTLVSGVAHEINNPTNFIMLNLPLIEDSWEAARPILEEFFHREGDFDFGGLPYSEMKEHLPSLFEGIREGGRRIRNIVEDLKNFARQESSDISGKVDINAVVRDAISLLGNLIRKNAPRFRVRYGEGLPPIRGNAQRLEQVIINLVQNACQALTDRDQAIRVFTVHDAEKQEIRIEVQDEGRGIPSHVLPHIQDPFFTTRRDQGGTGLGLSISATIIREHGGRMDIRSKEGEGSSFSLCLPLRPPALRKKVLVVDDDRDTRLVLSEMLRASALLDVHEADSGMAACLKLGSLKPDLLVLDLHMPDMDGLEVCEWVRTEPELKNLKILVVTGYAGQKAQNQLQALGISHILTKPVSLKTLRQGTTDLLGPLNEEELS